ncbi:conjugal transfer protein TraR [Pseudoalteromonas sp. T1lg65]|uniref:conjugal transfer protein TraR n=1 Tax=Pseudoalteromonas sp. T1lg65 TaxID=2077101 RepID=UPI003F7A848D
MNENITDTYQQDLINELTHLRADFLEELKSSPNQFTIELAGKLESTPASNWLDVVAEKLNPEQFPQYARMMKVEAALCQMDIGQFGFCCDCEQQIDTEQLAKDPATQRCNHCATKVHLNEDKQQK